MVTLIKTSHFSRDELAGHALDAEGWNEVQVSFGSIEDLVKWDGWTHLETFDVALRLLSDLRKGALEHLKGEVGRISKRRPDGPIADIDSLYYILSSWINFENGTEAISVIYL